MAKSKVQSLHYTLLAVVISVLAWSGIAPKDRTTWILETAPVFIGFALVAWTFKKHRLTNLLYILIAVHCVVLSIGGKYTYAEVPLGFWIQELFDFKRNHYDRLGHFMQGFAPAILAREILIRNKAVNGKGWLFLFVTSICLAFSAVYEFIEWFAALVSEEGSAAFLGTQGDVWDTQWDMFLALVGALLAQIISSKYHDKQLKRVSK